MRTEHNVYSATYNEFIGIVYSVTQHSNARPHLVLLHIVKAGNCLVM